MGTLLLLTFIFLCAGVVMVPIATRLGLGSVLGYLIAGIAISPILRWLHVDVVQIQHIAEFGVVMMLFLVGLELEPKKLWGLRSRLLGLGGGQVGLTTALITAGLIIGFNWPWQYALATGLILALSSTAIVLQTLEEKGLMQSEGGQASFSVLLFQDVAVIPILALMPLLAMPELAADAGTVAAHGDGDHGLNINLVDGREPWQRALITMGAVSIVILMGTLLSRPIFRFISWANLRELFTAGALVLVVAIALLMTMVGLSPALGTFLAGVVLAESEYRHELESDIAPFKGLLLGVFFVTVGASIDFAALLANLNVVVGATIGLIALKAMILLILARLFNIGRANRWLFSLSLAQTGEFGFVLLSFALSNAILPKAIHDQLLLIVALSMLLTPLLFILYDKVIAPRFSQSQDREADPITASTNIIIAGRGRVGGIVDRVLESGGYQTTVIDYSAKQLDITRKLGFLVHFGDATRPDLLHAAGIAGAKMIIVTIDNRDSINEIVKYVHRNYPSVHIIARAMDRDHVFELWSLGCRDIIRETYDSSLRIARSAYEALGYSRDTAEAAVHEFDTSDRKTMIEVAELWDAETPYYENELLVAKVQEMRGDWRARLQSRVGEILRADENSGE